MEMAIKNVGAGQKSGSVGLAETQLLLSLMLLDLRINLHLDSATNASMLLSGKNFSFENMIKRYK